MADRSIATRICVSCAENGFGEIMHADSPTEQRAAIETLLAARKRERETRLFDFMR
jgi:hypothetical protein